MGRNKEFKDTKVGDILYRVEDWFSNKYEINFIEFKVVKLTDCGLWITQYYKSDLFVDDKIWMSSPKRAATTKNKALYSYYRRKVMHVKYANQDLDKAKNGLKMAIHHMDKQEIEYKKHSNRLSSRTLDNEWY